MRVLIVLLLAIIALRGHASEWVIVHTDEIAGLPQGSIVRPYVNIPYASAVLPAGDGLVQLDHGYQHDGEVDIMLTESLPLIGQPAAVTNGATGSGWSVAVIDTGVDSSHPDLVGRIVGEACFGQDFFHPDLGQIAEPICPGGGVEEVGPGVAQPCVDTYDRVRCYHGTHVANIAAQTAPQAGIVAIQVYHLNVFGSLPRLTLRESDIVRALDWLISEAGTYNVRVVNISLGNVQGFVEPCINRNAAFQRAVTDLKFIGVQVVVSSGNSGRENSQNWPSCTPGVVSVASTTKTDILSDFSNLASYTTLAAPGEQIVSAMPGGGYAAKDGTSFAAPHVSGAVVGLATLNPQTDKGVTALRITGTEISGAVNTVPRIDLDRASQVFLAPDTDGDGWGDAQDNCTQVANGWGVLPELLQRDTNGDGYGNVCDPDLDDSGLVNGVDLNIMRNHILLGTYDSDADLNGDLAVDQADVDILAAMYYGPPGPSGIAP